MEKRLAEEIGKLLTEHGLSIAVAESATGGLVSYLITSVPGSSNYFKGGIVAYANGVKVKALGVAEKTLESYGAVSCETTKEMAEGIRRLMDVDIGLSDTGIAGPGGATPGKPVGLFYIGLSSQRGTQVKQYIFRADRQGNRQSAAEAALRLLKEYLLEPE